ncbi:MAG: hypothetical protein KC478_06905 [Bacteriovoracaceae bacterium]|nr:hypothetical protein [Bacteriovoracaceae bacterium]
MLKFILTSIFLASSAFAALDHAPSNFNKDGESYVFVDFQSASYKIVYDVESAVAGYKAIIEFEQTHPGRPIFDVHMMPLSAHLNDKSTSVISISDPDNETRYKTIDEVLPAGVHKLELTGRIEKNIKFSSDTVRSGFWMSDLTDRHYLEQYLPSNLEYDQFAMELEVKVIGTDYEHQFFSNGSESTIGKNHFKIIFPEYFTTSSVYFHLAEIDRFKKTSFEFNSISGRTVPVRIYSKYSRGLRGITKKVQTILDELEEKFGPWGHPGLTIYISGMGGMEHSGATITSLSALGHELTHSYFARGIMPVNGNSGWLDEAVASWRDKGYKSKRTPFYSSAKLSGYSIYRRITDRKAYTEGASFMAYLNYELHPYGGLTKFLSQLYETHLHDFWTTKIFIEKLNEFSGQDFTQSFDRYIFGQRIGESNPESEHSEYHPSFSEQDYLDLL